MSSDWFLSELKAQSNAGRGVTPCDCGPGQDQETPVELKSTVTARVVDGGLRSSDREPVWAPS